MFLRFLLVQHAKHELAFRGVRGFWGGTEEPRREEWGGAEDGADNQAEGYD